MASTAKILIVEDEGIVAKDLQSRLKGFGYSVPAIAASGKEALAKAAEFSPDLVLMDIRLKGEMDGIETAEKIRAVFKVPVVYSTAYADDATLERAKVTEPFGYILKPFEERELYSVIEMALYKHQMERKLIESERWLATTLQSIGDGVIATDKTGRIKFMNPVAETLTGWSRAKAAGKPLAEVFRIIDMNSRKPSGDPLEKVMQAGTIIELSNHTALIAKDGTERRIADSVAPMRDENGIIIGIVLVFRDVTMKQRMEEELAQVHKLESLGLLAGGIAHDFNNLLTAILGNISLAKMISTSDSAIEKRLEDAEKASFRARDLTQQLLTFASGGAPVRQTASIVEIIKDSTGFALSGSNVRCSFKIADNLWPVEIDLGQISQVINNIIINADHAMPEGGTITVTCTNVSIKETDIYPLAPGNYVRMTIADEGHGIPKEHLTRIFDPYFTTKQKGSGLGLTICYSIIRAHDGHITVTSRLGRGASFTMHLPASHREMPCDPVREDALCGAMGRILVMDDEEIVRTIAGAILEQLGFEVELAADGSEAITRYRQAMETGRKFSAVIMDLTVSGGMGGKEAIRALLEIDPEIRAIVSSGYSTDPIMADFSAYGFSGVIAKPYRPEELCKTLNDVILQGLR